MTTKLSELFEDARAASIEFDGDTVYSMYTIDDVAAGSELRLQFEQSNPERPQAIRLAIAKNCNGTLEVESGVGDDIVLWTDTSPELTSLKVNSDAPTSIDIWNMWRNSKGQENAWIGNAGMHVRKQGRTLWFNCSDAFGDPVFDDLVVSVSIDGPQEHRSA